MTFRYNDDENAVREGWSRDTDNEVTMDGYNAIIQITTNDGTSGFEVQNSIGATSFLVDSGGDGYFAKRLGVGTENPETALEVIGKIRTNELQITSSALPGYILTSDVDGNATWQSPGSTTGVSDTTFQENKNAQSQINQTIISELDGYVDTTGTIADGYVAFFTSDGTVAGDNDLYFDRVNNQLRVSSFKLSTTPIDGYVLTTDSSGNATWQENISSPTNHRSFDQLVHEVAETSYDEYIYSGSNVTNIIIWTSSEKVTKIREQQFIYSGNKATSIVTIQYDSYGNAVETITESINYSGQKVVDISRTLS